MGALNRFYQYNVIIIYFHNVHFLSQPRDKEVFVSIAASNIYVEANESFANIYYTIRTDHVCV